MSDLAHISDDALMSEVSRRELHKRSAQASDDLDGAIRRFVEKHPDLPQSVIAWAFRVNQGRVSEAVRGKRQ